MLTGGGRLRAVARLVSLRRLDPCELGAYVLGGALFDGARWGGLLLGFAFDRAQAATLSEPEPVPALGSGGGGSSLKESR
jgi:hypothetical protein